MESLSAISDTLRLIGTTMSSAGIGAGKRRGAGWAWALSAVLPEMKARPAGRCGDGGLGLRGLGPLEAGFARPDRLRR
jgi:hypothetical protein